MQIKSKLITLIMFYFFIHCTYAQIIMDRNLLAEVNQTVIAKYGQSVEVQFIYHIDSSHIFEGNYPTPHTTMDSYGTLFNSTIFTGYKFESGEQSKGIVGIYKNGIIIWDSDTTINLEGMNAITLFSIADINGDGKIDLIFAADEFTQSSNGLERLYIYSWDVSNGQLISELDSLGISTIVSLTGMGEFDFVDVNGDGIYEITGLWYLSKDDIDEKQVTYYWNGYKYVFDPALPQPQYSDYLVQNNLEVNLRASVTKTDSGFIYSYYLKNLPTSKQEINSIYFKCGVDSAIRNFPPQNWYSVSDYDLFGFEDLHVPTLYSQNNFIRIDSFQIFSYTSYGLPSISHIYIQGYNRTPPLNSDDLQMSFQQDHENILNNSYHSYTVGPANILDTLNNLNFLDALLNYNSRSLELGWIIDSLTVNKYANYFTTAKTQLQQNNIAAARSTLQTVLQEVDIDSTDNLTSEAYALLRYNTEYLLEHLSQSSPNLTINLKSSTGTLLTTGLLQYYEGSWKDAVNNGDGTFTIITTLPTVSLRMNYEYGSQTVSNIPAQNNAYTFQTINAAVQLRNSLGNFIDQGTVQYYAGAWRTFGTTTNGVATKELLPINYSFRMTYEFASIDKQQNLSVDPIVIFQTVNAAVQLNNSLGNFIDAGTVQYYSGAWRNFGPTTNGVVSKELLPINYSFRMTYEFASIDKQQNLSVDPTVVFQTVNAAVQLKNSLGNFIDAGTVQYYSGAWRNFGTTTNGVATKELLPINYSFRMTYEFASIDKQQNLLVDPTVVFQTVNAAVQLKNSLGNLIYVGTVQYYAGAWRTFGTTSSGVATKELLPINYSFRMTHEYLSKDKQQNLSTNSVVDFQTVLSSVKVSNTNNQPLNNSAVKYYAGAWRDLGTTNTEGIATKELLPQNINFRASYGNVSLDKQQDIGSNNLVEFLLNIP